MGQRGFELKYTSNHLADLQLLEPRIDNLFENVRVLARQGQHEAINRLTSLRWEPERTQSGIEFTNGVPDMRYVARLATLKWEEPEGQTTNPVEIYGPIERLMAAYAENEFRSLPPPPAGTQRVGAASVRTFSSDEMARITAIGAAPESFFQRMIAPNAGKIGLALGVLGTIAVSYWKRRASR